MGTRIMAANGAVFIDGYPAPIPGGTLQASLNGTIVTVGNILGGSGLVKTDYTNLADDSGNGFGSPAAAMAYLAIVLAAPPSRTVQAIAGASVVAATPLAVSRATGQLMAARADTYALAFVAGLSLADVAAGFPAQAGRGAITIEDWTTVTGTAALAPGEPYFLAPAGGLSPSAINPGALCVARVGLAASPTTLIVTPSDPILL